MPKKDEMAKALELAIFAVDENNHAQERLDAIREAERIRMELNVTWSRLGAALDEETVANLIDGIEYQISRENAPATPHAFRAGGR